MVIKKKKGYFSISAVSEMLGVHQQTIRMYEREGLIAPRRSEGNTRLFSEEDVERLENIIYYTNKLGVNLAGVEIVLKMQKRIEKLQRELHSGVENLFEESKRELEIDKNDHITRIKDATNNLNEIRSKNMPSEKKVSQRKISQKNHQILELGENDEQ